MNSKKSLLILEKSSTTLEIKNDPEGGNIFILEGIFGEIGIRNKNNRIYSEKEYLPQIESLQDKIKSSKLVGELDHPKQFDVTLSNISHVVEKLEYNKETKQVVGRIRLLNTPKGKLAQDLIKDGIPLHISSRAAGSVDERGNVTIKRLFTYDLVADPGFESAQLNRVNEQYGFENDDNLFIYEIDETVQQTEGDKYKNKNTLMDKNSVSVEDFDKYSNFMKQKFEKLEQAYKDMQENVSSMGKANENEMLVKFVNSIVEKVNKLGKYVHMVAETVDGEITRRDHIVDGVNRLKDYVQYQSRVLDDSIDNNSALKESIQSLVESVSLLENEQSNQLAYLKYIAEEHDSSILYVENVAETADYGIQYAEKIAMLVENNIQHGKYLTENVNDVIDYVNYMKKGWEVVAQYNSITGKKINEMVDIINNNEPAKTTTVVESNDWKKTLDQKIEMLIESAQKHTADYDNPEIKFVELLESDYKKEFIGLSSDLKKKVIESVKGRTSAEDINSVYESIVHPTAKKLDLIENMPEIYRKTWETLSESKKNSITAQSKYYNLKTQYQIDNFWSTRDLSPDRVQFQPLNESQKNDNPEEKTDYLVNFETEMKRRFGKE